LQSDAEPQLEPESQLVLELELNRELGLAHVLESRLQPAPRQSLDMEPEVGLAFRIFDVLLFSDLRSSHLLRFVSFHISIL
jgi:hypothetical protein